MKPRQTVLEKFSTFLRFETDAYQLWLKDARQHRRMSQGIQKNPEHLEEYWVVHWHQVWQTSQPSSEGFLVAYLQEPCFWAVQKVQRRLMSLQMPLADLFQMAIASSEQVLNGFDSDQGFALSSYANVMFANAVRGSLRQQKAADLCTDWTLLRKTSRKRMQQALQTLGLADIEQSQYLWAWDCFKQVYVPTQQAGYSTLPPPTSEQWDQMAQLFNQGRLTQCDPSTESQDGNAIATWIKASGKAVRAYLYPQQLSLNQPKVSDAGGEYLDDLLDEDNLQGLELLEVKEAVQTRRQQQKELQAALSSIIQSLEPDSQKLLTYYYRDHLKQKAIAEALKIQQYAVSRQLARVRKSILKGLAQWSHEELHISLDSNLLNSMNTVLEDWLEAFFEKDGSSKPAMET